MAVEMSIRINDAFHAMRNLSLLKIAKVKPDLSNQNPEGHYLQNKTQERLVDAHVEELVRQSIRQLF